MSENIDIYQTVSKQLSFFSHFLKNNAFSCSLSPLLPSYTSSALWYCVYEHIVWQTAAFVFVNLLRKN